MNCLARFLFKQSKSYNLPTAARLDDAKNKSDRHGPNEINHKEIVNDKNERTESGFDSISEDALESINDIPPPPQRMPPNIPNDNECEQEEKANVKFQISPIPSRKPHVTEIPDINFIQATPSPILRGNHNENSDNKNDIIDELNIISSTSSNRNSRKKGVISDKISHNDTINIEISVFLKDKQSVDIIKDAILANDFLSNILTDDTLKAVVDAMSPQYYDADKFIIKEGEVGSHFYVSADGTFQVIKEGNILKTFGPSVVFGELAILYKAKRFASIKSLTSTKVWVLERKVFQKIMIQSGRKEQEENVKFLKSVSKLHDLPAPILLKISDLLKKKFYPANSTIIKQGDVGDKFYIIKGGSVNVIKRNENGDEKLVGILKKGACFGEQALLHQEKRLASVIANSPGTECLELDRNAFDNYLGSLETIKNIKVIDQEYDVKTMTVTSCNIKTEFSHVALNELRIIGTLGVGGFGQVFLVQYKERESFALKRLKKIEMVQQQQQEHAYSEKEVMLACNSPFIVRLFKTYRDKKYLYFLMEACLGGDLWTVLQKHKCFDEKTAKFMMACVVEALSYLHSRNMIYRDLKPENLMLDEHGYIKLVDFGFAKFIKPTQKTWTFAGTPEYVAPEIILNKGHDRAIDYWALGVFVHELLIGKPPFRGKDYIKTYNLILRGIDSIQLSPKIPKKAQVIIKRLCRKNPAERLGYQKNGINDIRNHTWYSGFDWEKLRTRKMAAPLIRPVKSNTDLSNFDEYPSKERDDPPDETSDWDKDF